MRKFLLMTTALVCLGSKPADAAPVLAVAGQVATWFGSLGAFTQAAIKIGASLLLNAGIAAVTKSKAPKQQDLIRDLLQPTSLPVYRFVYGKCWAPGTPAPVRVKGEFIYACFILNSRPSAGPFTVFMDKREVKYTGDPHNFSGTGATATNDPFGGHFQYWIGKGNQVGPPATIVGEAPDLYIPTDGWRGRTVIWIKVKAGDNDSRQERWPSSPPEVIVDGKWSLLRDPRNPSAPAAWSANQALCTLDCLRSNPIKAYEDRNLWLDTFAWAADVADAGFPVKSGGRAPIEVNGVLVFSEGSELEDQVVPLANTGGCDFTRVGGQLGLVPAVYQEPVTTISDVLDDQPMTFNLYRPSSELFTEVTAQYPSPERMFEDAATPVYKLAGAQNEDGGLPKLGQYTFPFTTDHRQAQYIAAILGRKTRMQRSWSGVLPGEAFDLVAGSAMRLNLPYPYQRRNGIYQVESIHPGFDPIGLEGAAMRCPTIIRETSPSIYFWNPQFDEQDIVTEEFDTTIKGVQPISSISLISDASTLFTSGDTAIARVRFSFDVSPSSTVVAYQWEYKEGTGNWQSGGTIGSKTVDNVGRIYGYIVPVSVGTTYTVRVKPVSILGAAVWRESSQIVASVGPVTVTAPAPVSAVAGSGQIAVTFRSPNQSDYRGMSIYVSSTNNSASAALLSGPIYGAANSTVTEIQSGLNAGSTRFYFAKSIDKQGGSSPFSASISGTSQ